MTILSRSCSSLSDPKYGKPIKIFVWLNGEFENPPHTVRVASSDLRSWNGLFNFLTRVLRPRFGAVRKLYHLETRKVVDCLQEIQSDDKFVAVGIEPVRFKKNGYLTEEQRLKLKHNKSAKDFYIENSKSVLNFMDYTKRNKRTVIYVMVSGRSCQEPVKVVLTEADYKTWNKVLEYLAYQLDVEEGVQYICKLSARIIFRPQELRHGSLYIAVPFNDKFVKMDYLSIFQEFKPNKIIKKQKTKTKLKRSGYATKRYKPISPVNVKCIRSRCMSDCRRDTNKRPQGGGEISNMEVQTEISGTLKSDTVDDHGDNIYDVDSRSDSIDVVEDIVEKVSERLDGDKRTVSPKPSPTGKRKDGGTQKKLDAADGSFVETVVGNVIHEAERSFNEMVEGQKHEDGYYEDDSESEIELKQTSAELPSLEAIVPEKEKVMTSFAELAKNKKKQQQQQQQQRKGPVSPRKLESPLSTSMNTHVVDRRKSVSFTPVQTIQITVTRSVNSVDVRPVILSEHFRTIYTMPPNFSGHDSPMPTNQNRRRKDRDSALWKALSYLFNALIQL